MENMKDNKQTGDQLWDGKKKQNIKVQRRDQHHKTISIYSCQSVITIKRAKLLLIFFIHVGIE